MKTNKPFLTVIATIILFATMQSVHAYTDNSWQQYYKPNYIPNSPQYSATYSFYQPTYSQYLTQYNSPHFSSFYDANSGFGGYSISLASQGYNNNFYTQNGIYYWDNTNLKWKRDPIDKWIHQGDWREQVQRARAVNFMIQSWNARYDASAGKTSAQAFSYTDGAKDSANTSPSNFRNQLAYDPLFNGVNNYQNYYYQPRYDAQTQTYNWRY